jgi:hypothetical protein
MGVRMEREREHRSIIYGNFRFDPFHFGFCYLSNRWCTTSVKPIHISEIHLLR